MSLTTIAPANPVEQFLRTDRMPHIWCPGCGIGTTVNCFTRALIDAKVDLDNLAIVSGIGCSGRVAGYVRLDSFHTTHGRAIPFATGLNFANPKLQVVVYSGDGDLSAIGGNHLIHAARRNVDLKVICVNNLIYAMTGGQTAPTTPADVITSTNPYGTFDTVSISTPGGSRWSGLRRALDDLSRAATFKGDCRNLPEAGILFYRNHLPLSDVVSAAQQDGRRSGHDEVLQGKEQVKNGAPTSEVGLDKQGEIVVGKFVDRTRHEYRELMREQMQETLGSRYVDPVAAECAESEQEAAGGCEEGLCS